MDNKTFTPNLPYNAIYLRKYSYWLYGRRMFAVNELNVQVIGETDKSYRIRYLNKDDSLNSESWVKKSKIRFKYLQDGGFCDFKQSYVPNFTCWYCRVFCAMVGKDLPKN